mgnify:CR=1 FL=1
MFPSCEEPVARDRVKRGVMSSAQPSSERPTFAQALRFWLKLGFISFGGPTGQIAIMHTELVDRKRWISESRFLHALNYCMLLPGPEAQQLATYSGWLLHGTLGGIAAGALFVLPSAVLLWALSWVYVSHGNVAVIASMFDGLKPAVVAIVAVAVIRIGRRALKAPVAWLLAGLAFAAIAVFDVPFPLLIFAAGGVGLLLHREFGSPLTDSRDSLIATDSDGTDSRFMIRRSVRLIIVCGLLWFAPVAMLAAWLGGDHTIVREGVFFSNAAMVTFGGAYAVLPYVAQQAVDHYGWLSGAQMIDGLGLAETTPGPLIMVVQFVGFVAAWHHPGGLSPFAAATLGTATTVWVTFVPCFLWILLGAPYIERLRSHGRLNGALSAITAAVVGVILNLAVWFAGHALWTDSGAVDLPAMLFALLLFAGMARWHWPIHWTVAAGVLFGLIGWATS